MNLIDGRTNAGFIEWLKCHLDQPMGRALVYRQFQSSTMTHFSLALSFGLSRNLSGRLFGMTMRPLLFAKRVLVRVGDKEVEKIAVSHDDDTDAIQVLRIVVSELPASGFTYVPQGAPFDTYEKGQWRIKQT